MAGGSRTLEVKFVGDDAQLSKTFGNVSSGGQKLEAHVGSLTGALKKLALGFGAVEGAKKAVDFLEDSAKAAAENQASMAQDGLAVKNSGENWKKLGGPIDDALTKMSTTSGFIKSDLQESFAKLETATKSHSAALKDENIAMNIAAARNISLSAATKIVSNAQLGSATAARRVGVIQQAVTTSTDALKAKYEALAATQKGKLTPAQKEAEAAQEKVAKAQDKTATSTSLLDKLQAAFAGGVKTRSKTMAGEIAIFGEQWNDIKIKVGDAILPLVLKGIGDLLKAINYLSNNKQFQQFLTEASADGKVLANDIQALAVKWFPTAKAAVEAFAGDLKTAANWLQQNKALVEAIAGPLIAGAAAFLVVSEAIKIVTAAQAALDVVMDANPIGIIVIAIAALSAGLYELYEHSKTAQQIMNAAFADIKAKGTEAFAFLTNTVIPNLKAAFDRLKPDVVQVVNDIETAIKTFVSQVEQNWGTLKAIFGPGLQAALKIAETDAKAVLQEIESAIDLFGNVLHGRWGAAWGDLKTMVSTAINAAFSIVKTILGAMAQTAGNLAVIVGHQIADGIKKAPSFLEGLAGDLISQLSNDVNQVANDMLTEAAKIGTEIGQGLINGVESMAGAVKSKLEGLGKKAVGWLGAAAGVASPSKITFAQGQWIAEGLANGVDAGSAKVSAAAKRLAAEATKQLTTINNVVTTVGSAFDRLSSTGMQAFDAQTTAILAKNSAKFDAWKTKASAALDAVNAKLTANNATLTPSEQALSDLQSSHDEAGRQQAISDATNQLGADQGSGADASTILADQQALADAKYQEQVASLQKSADAERSAADAKLAIDQAANQKSFDVASAAHDKLEAKQQLDLQSERNLKAQNITDTLAAMEKELEGHPKLWKKDHTAIMKLFKQDFGPDYETAGKNLGDAFKTGVNNAFDGVSGAAAKLAKAISDYLELHSPARKGPLSTLNTWWAPLAATLASGIDTRSLDQTLSSLAGGGSPASLSGSNYGSIGSGATIISLTQHVAGSVVTQNELHEAGRQYLIQHARRNGGSALGGLA